MLLEKIKGNKTIFTRMCIAEATIALLAYHELKQLKVYQVVQKAGVSRMTFYKYYSSPQAALEDYLKIIIAKFVIESNGEIRGSEIIYEHILFALNFFDGYRDFFIIMKTKGLYTVLIDSINEFVSTDQNTGNRFDIYKRCSFAATLLNCFLMWEMSGKVDRAEDVARAICELYGSPAPLPEDL